MFEDLKTNKVQEYNHSQNHLNKVDRRSEKNYDKNNQLISIIIPLYNEEHTINDVINKIPNHLLFEIIVVDDGSTDNSINKIKEIRNRQIKIMKHKQNRGYGAAILTGFKFAQGEIIVTMDADSELKPRTLNLLIQKFKDPKIGAVSGTYKSKPNSHKNWFYFLCL